MKKIGKVKKTKIIEHAKTVIIVLLFLSCIFFCSKIFETYREQTTSDSIWGQKNNTNFSQTLTNTTKEGVLNDFLKLSRPSAIVLTFGQSRKAVSQPSDEFDVLSAASAKLLEDGYNSASDKIFDCNIAEWQNALKGNSVYIKYPGRRQVWFENEIYQAKGYVADRIEGYNEILILPGENLSCEVFLRDREEETIIKLEVANPEINTVKEILKKYTGQENKDCIFAWETDFSGSDYDGLVLDPMTMLWETEKPVPDIVTNITRAYKLGLNFTKATEFVSGLIGIFGYNPNTIRQYVSNDDSLIFVGETGSLSVHPEGKIEYKALDANEGILITTDGQIRPSTALSGLLNVIERIFELSGISKDKRDFDIKLTKMPKNGETSKKFELCFDYFTDGNKLIFSDVPAIYAAVDNGVLVELKMEVRDIQRLENKSQLEGITIDNFKAEHQSLQAVLDAESVYRCTENGEKIKATWEILSVR